MQQNEYLKYLKSKVQLGKDVFVAPNATLIGNIQIGNSSSVWYNAVLRADFDKIIIGSGTNVQDGVIMHVDANVPISIGNNVIVGHGALIHGCTIDDGSLIGMRATVMNRAKVGKHCVIGAHALVTEDMEIPDYSMVLGAPGKIVRTLPETVKEKLAWGAKVYKEEAKKYLGLNDFEYDVYGAREGERTKQHIPRN